MNMKKFNKGFSLLETIVSLVIISILILTFITLYIKIIKTNKKLKFEYNLTFILNNLCNEIYYDKNSYTGIYKLYLDDEGLSEENKVTSNYLLIEGTKFYLYNTIKIYLYINDVKVSFPPSIIKTKELEIYV